MNKLTIEEQISFIQRYILVHSIIYYHFDTNVISDALYDRKAYELVAMIKKYPEEFNISMYRDIYIGFDGTTGFDLADKLTSEHREYLENIAWKVIDNHNRGMCKNNNK